MKKILTILIVLIMTGGFIYAQTPGTLTVSATTSSAGGNYAPKNIVAIWIENDQGNFVKTLMAYAQTRRTHLNTWEASTTAAGSPFNSVDAITGPTRNSHATRTCSWDGTNVDGIIVDDGTYHVWMELTDKNGTGNFSSFSFTKDVLVQNLAPMNVPSFSSISIIWEPIITSVNDNSFESNINIYPNPTEGIIQISGDNVDQVRIHNSAGEEVDISNVDHIDLSDQPDGTYYITVTTNHGIATKKVVKISK